MGGVLVLCCRHLPKITKALPHTTFFWNPILDTTTKFLYLLKIIKRALIKKVVVKRPEHFLSCEALSIYPSSIYIVDTNHEQL